MTVTERLTTGAHPLFGQAVTLLDDYRQYYGANPAPEVVARWLREQLIEDRMRLYVAGTGEVAQGVAGVSVIPAALTLRTVWLVRDLYVDPDARGRGVARALMAYVEEAARAEGAHRLSLQTEAANERALHLYSRIGFERVSEVALLHRIL